MTDNPHYMTPEEAEKMGCCMSMNRPEFAAACIGKTCMAWRWENEEKEWINTGAGKGHWKPAQRTHGFCGMVRT